MSFEIKEGVRAYYLDSEYEIKKLLDFDTVLAIKLETGVFESIPLKHISAKPLSEKPVKDYQDLSQVPKKLLEKANNRLEAIKPVLEVRSKKLIEERAKEVGISTATLYNWLKAYRATNRLSSLVFEGTSGGKGKKRLDEQAEAILNSVIEEFYLSSQKPTAQKTFELAKLKCKRAGVKHPGVSTVRRRIKDVNEKKLLERREGKKSAEHLTPVTSEYPDGNYPLEVVQIDHTRVDIMLVDSVHRLELGRPWVTLAIDVFSRMVVGFYVSLDTPGYFGTGQCLANAILPKDHILKKYGLKSRWPVGGFPTMVHMDNAREFRGNDMELVCKEYGITIVWRPVARPHFGGHVERLVRTLNEDIHTLQGTTFSNTTQRGTYDSGAKAVMTLDEFEQWLTTLIVDVYHNKTHSALGKSPLKRFEEGIFGGPDTPPRGIITKVEKEDAERIKINLLPVEERTIQRYGIVIEGITYYAEVLNYFIGKKRTYTIRRDPRDIGRIYFYDDEKRQYYVIPIKDRRKPGGISIWEYRAAKKYIQGTENKEADEDGIFDAIERLKAIEEDSKQKTKTARKKLERSVQLKSNPPINGETVGKNNTTVALSGNTILDDDEDLFTNIKPFDGITDKGKQ